MNLSTSPQNVAHEFAHGLAFNSFTNDDFAIRSNRSHLTCWPRKEQSFGPTRDLAILLAGPMCDLMHKGIIRAETPPPEAWGHTIIFLDASGETDPCSDAFQIFRLLTEQPDKADIEQAAIIARFAAQEAHRFATESPILAAQIADVIETLEPHEALLFTPTNIIDLLAGNDSELDVTVFNSWFVSDSEAQEVEVYALLNYMQAVGDFADDWSLTPQGRARLNG